MTLNHLIRRFDFVSDVTGGHSSFTRLVSTTRLFVHKSAKMLRTERDLRRTAAVKTSLLRKPKGKESLA